MRNTKPDRSQRRRRTTAGGCHSGPRTHTSDNNKIDSKRWIVPRKPLSEKLIQDLLALGGKSAVPSLGAKQVLFLEAVRELGEDAYGMRIAVWLETHTKTRINIGQIYSIAKGLADEGMIEGSERQSPSGRGRDIVVYTLTDIGEMMYEVARRRMSS